MKNRRRCAETDCRHAPWAHGEKGCRLCDCRAWLDRKVHRWRRDVFDAWFLATEKWVDHREAVCQDYAAEMAEFEERHPRPRLADFMRAMSPGVPPEEATRLFDFDVCSACRGTGHQTDTTTDHQRRAS